MNMMTISGGVTAAKGFQANGVHCGIRKNRNKRDLALIVSDRPASAAAVYTTNLVKGAPLAVTKRHLRDGQAQAIICNSGNANTCNADGPEVAQEMCNLVGQALQIAPDDVIVASTGVIGQPLELEPIRKGMPNLVAGLGDHSGSAAEAILTTDLRIKETAVQFEIGGVTCRMGGIAKGSGMIHPNMATMLVFITTDVQIDQQVLQQTLREDCQGTFNMISVDGDTSTNDMVTVLANGAAGNAPIKAAGPALDTFKAALNQLTTFLCRAIAQDGEGATKLLECVVRGADTLDNARKVAKSVISSSLLKSAMFGADANWGRVLCAAGYSGAELDIQKIDVAFASQAGELPVCAQGAGLPFSEDLARAILMEKEIQIVLDLNSGSEEARAWGCDLTYDYVKINGDYRT